MRKKAPPSEMALKMTAANTDTKRQRIAVVDGVTGWNNKPITSEIKLWDQHTNKFISKEE